MFVWGVVVKGAISGLVLFFVFGIEFVKRRGSRRFHATWLVMRSEAFRLGGFCVTGSTGEHYGSELLGRPPPPPPLNLLGHSLLNPKP